MCGQCSESICIFSDLPRLQNICLKCYWQWRWKEEKKLIAGRKPGELSISEQCRNVRVLLFFVSSSVWQCLGILWQQHELDFKQSKYRQAWQWCIKDSELTSCQASTPHLLLLHQALSKEGKQEYILKKFSKILRHLTCFIIFILDIWPWTEYYTLH